MIGQIEAKMSKCLPYLILKSNFSFQPLNVAGEDFPPCHGSLLLPESLEQGEE